MIIYFAPSANNSVDPGEENVLLDVNYVVNGVSKVGALSLDFPTANQIAAAVWNRQTNLHTVAGSFGAQINFKLLTVAKFLGLK